jgi:hypothetical protein
MMNAFFCFVFIVRFINFEPVKRRFKHIYLRMKRNNELNTQGNKEEYEAPVIEIVEVRVEQGFQNSGPLGERPGDEDSF